MRVHLDTDFAGDIDDLCALALLLRWPEPLELSGVTTLAELGGRRAGYAQYVLSLAGRPAVPIAAGAECSGGYYPYELGLPPHARYWPAPAAPLPGPPQAALDLLKASIEQGAVIIAIGPLTNLALLEAQHPGILREARLFLMGGYLYPTRSGYPAWGNADDFNLQIDPHSACRVLQNAACPTLIPLSVTVETALRRAHLPALRRAGALGQLIARQAEAFAEDERLGVRLTPACPALPPDLINFQHDPLACAVALGWREGVEIEELRARVEIEDGVLVARPDPAGRPLRVVTRVDGPRFDQMWLDVVSSSPSPS